MYELNETRRIALPRGGELEVQLSHEFLWRVSQQFAVPLGEVTDDHIRMFVWGAMKTAIDKVEDVGGPA